MAPDDIIVRLPYNRTSCSTAKKQRSRSVQSTPPPHEGMPKSPEEKPSPRTGFSFSLILSTYIIIGQSACGQSFVVISKKCLNQIRMKVCFDETNFVFDEELFAQMKLLPFNESVPGLYQTLHHNVKGWLKRRERRQSRQGQR